jgi:hypothetical protein
MLSGHITRLFCLLKVQKLWPIFNWDRYDVMSISSW